MNEMKAENLMMVLRLFFKKTGKPQQNGNTLGKSNKSYKEV